LHFPLEAGYVAVAEVLAQLLHLFQLQQVDSQNLDSSDHKLVSLLTVAEQGTFVLLLVLDKRLDVNIEALTRRALRRLCGELTLLEEQGKEGEERVLVDLPLVRLELGLVPRVRKGRGLHWLSSRGHLCGFLLVDLCRWREQVTRHRWQWACVLHLKTCVLGTHGGEGVERGGHGEGAPEGVHGSGGQVALDLL